MNPIQMMGGNNPMMALMNAMRNGGNPMAIIQQMAAQNPQVAQAMKLIPGMSKDDIVVITISGRGDKDVKSVARFMGVDIND